ncbi:MAG: ABC transporter substrate-binding protein [Alphaproteobacteria bacterium]
MNRTWLLATAAFVSGIALSSAAGAETIVVGIGHQSQVTNTVAGGVVMEKLKLVEKHLPKTGKYAGATFEVVYQDYSSGPPITNQMLAGKLAFGVMGDYPLVVNGAKFQEAGKASLYIVTSGYNLKGTGNGIVVPVASPYYTLQDLKGKSISTPFGSASWGMTLKVLRDQGLLDSINLQNQSPPVGVTNIAEGKIDAHADFTPWSEVMEFRGTGRKIFDGSEAGIPTLHGTVVAKEFADQYPEVVQAVVNATLDGQEWIAKDPLEAAIKVAEWTGVEKEVLYLYFSKGGISTFEGSLKPQWVDAMKYDHALLVKERDVPPLDFDKWIEPKWVKAAYEARGMSYEKQLATVVTPKADDPALKPELWVEGEGIKSFDSIAALVSALQAAEKAGKTVNASYVYDKPTGLKLFGQAAYYVMAEGGVLTAFMKKAAAEAFAASSKGKLVMLTDLMS